MPSLLAVLGLNTAPFRGSLQQSVADAKLAGSQMRSALGEKIGEKLPFLTAAGGATAALTALEEMIRQSIEWADKIDNISNRLGISTEAVQLWDHALKQDGSSIEAATGFFEKLAIARQKALQGSDKEVEAFSRLGVSMSNLSSMRVEDIAAEIARAFQSGDPQKLIADLRAVGGKGAGELVAAFRNGLGELVAPGQSVVQVVSDEDIARLKEAGDWFTTTWTNIKGALAHFSAFLIQGVKDFNHDINVALHLMVGYVDAVITNISDGVKMLMRGDLKGAFSRGINPYQAALGAAKVYDERWKAEEEAARAKREKLKTEGLVGGDEESDTARQAKDAIKAADEIRRIKNETDKIVQQTAMREMTAAERVEELERRIAALKAIPEEDVMDEKDQAEIDLKVAQLNDQLSKAKEDEAKDQAKSMKENRFRAPEVNSLQRIGAYIDPRALGSDHAAKSAEHLAVIRQHITNMDKEIRKTRY